MIDIKKLRYTVIGAGRLGTALINTMLVNGFNVVSIVEKNKTNIRFRISKSVKVNRLLIDSSDVLIISVDDKNIDNVVKDLINASGHLKYKYVFHCSGSISSLVLEPLRKKGAITFSLHPNSSFPVKYSLIFNTPFIFDGKGIKAKNFAEKFAEALHSDLFVIPAGKKAEYHAYSVLLTNFLTNILNSARRDIFHSGNITSGVYKNLADSTIKNFAVSKKGYPLSGPVTREDTETIIKNIKSLREKDLRKIYKIITTISAKELLKRGKISRETAKKINQILQFD